MNSRVSYIGNVMSNIVAPRKRSTTLALLRHSLYTGLQSRVAKKFGVHKSVVSRVASGETTSHRISRALASEIARIEREVERIAERAA